MNCKLIILSWLLIFAFCVGCSSDDSKSISPEESVEGTWNLKNLSGGFLGLDEEYPIGSIKWSFDSINQTLIIENAVAESLPFIFESGTYSYSVVEENNQFFLYIEEDEYGGLDFSSNTMTIDQDKISYGVGADGFVLYFEK